MRSSGYFKVSKRFFELTLQNPLRPAILLGFLHFDTSKGGYRDMAQKTGMATIDYLHDIETQITELKGKITDPELISLTDILLGQVARL